MTPLLVPHFFIILALFWTARAPDVSFLCETQALFVMSLLFFETEDVELRKVKKRKKKQENPCMGFESK